MRFCFVGSAPLASTRLATARITPLLTLSLTSRISCWPSTRQWMSSFTPLEVCFSTLGVSTKNINPILILGEKFREVLKKKLGLGNASGQRIGKSHINRHPSNCTSMHVLHAQSGNAIVPSSVIINGGQANQKRANRNLSAQSTLETGSPSPLTSARNEELVWIPYNISATFF